MKFKDTVTGFVLETDNKFVIEQYKKHSERYAEIKPKAQKPKTTNTK